MTVKPFGSFEEAKAYLREHFHASTPADYSLDHMRTLMSALGNPQDRLRLIHVAGTSGKTSTAYYIAAMLTAAGQTTGLTVSPHVDEINERVQINGEPLNETEFCRALAEFLSIVQPLNIDVSRFEVTAAFAYWYFATQSVDYAVVEVGLGGLKDATNVVSRADKVCVITDIGLDHTEILGDSLPEIAAQKIGIVQPGNHVFTNQQAPEIIAVLQKHCQQNSAELHVVSNRHSDDYHARNWQLAYEAFEHVSGRDNLPAIDSKQLESTKQTLIPGRLEIRRLGDKTLVMDGAHNGQKMTAFIKTFKKIFPGVKPGVLVALKMNKDYAEIIEPLNRLASRLIVTGFYAEQDMPAKSFDPHELAAKFGAEAQKNQSEALKSLLSGPEEVCVITGSFYLLGQIRRNKLLG